MNFYANTIGYDFRHRWPGLPVKNVLDTARRQAALALKLRDGPEPLSNHALDILTMWCRPHA